MALRLQAEGKQAEAEETYLKLSDSPVFKDQVPLFIFIFFPCNSIAAIRFSSLYQVPLLLRKCKSSLVTRATAAAYTNPQPCQVPLPEKSRCD
jgi:hypothetical protein